MKVIRTGTPASPITKGETVVGEVYSHVDYDDVGYLRLQGGFAILNNGMYIDYRDAHDNGWVHEPYAQLDLQPDNA